MRKLWIVLLTLTLWTSAPEAATRTLAAAGGACTVGASWVGGVAPTAADDALLTGASGPMTVDTGCVMRSVNLTGYTNTVTHTSGVTWTIGDATAGLGNVALEFPSSGWTYTLGSSTTSAITFVSTSVTVQTVNFAGQTTGNVTFNAASNGSWQYTGAHLQGNASCLFTLTQGTLNINGQTVTWGRLVSTGSATRALTLGSATITLSHASTAAAWNVTATGMTMSAASSSITMAANAATDFIGGGFSYGTLTMTGNGITQTIRDANTFVNLNRSPSSTSKISGLSLFANQTITGTLALAGNSASNRLLLMSDTLGTPRTLTAATVTASNVDLRDIAGAGASGWNLAGITGNSGDCGGNSGISFTSPATQTATGTASFAWSTHGWTSRVPLPQDDVVINNAFIAGRTVTLDMPRAGKNISFVGATGTPTWAITQGSSIYGSVTKIAGMAMTSTAGLVFEGRGAFTITNAGSTWSSSVTINMIGGSLTLGDAWTSTNVLGIILNNGTLIDAGFALTTPLFTSNSGVTRAITQTGAWALTGTGAVFTVTSTGLTHTGTGSSMTISDTSSSSKTFAGGGLSTYGTLILPGGGTGSIDITGANTFEGLSIGAPKTVRFTAATTTTLFSAPVCAGSSGNVITLSSITAATHTLSLAGGTVSCDWLSLTNSIATGGAAWYAGANSTNGGGNTGWTFIAAPVGGNTGAFFQLLAR